MSKKKSVWNKGISLLLDDEIKNTNLAILLNELSLLALNRFKWTNLPHGMESRHIERGLFEHGQVAFFEMTEGGLFCLPCSPANGINVYGDPLGVTIHGIGYSKNYNMDQVVRILNNDNATPTSSLIYKYAGLLNEVEKTQGKNLKQQKRPFIVSTTKDNQLTMQNIINQIDDDEDVIAVDSKLTNGGNVGIHVLQTNSNYIVNNLQEHKNNIINELLTKLGLNNSNTTKKERLLVDEVNVNNGQILMYLDIEYKNRLVAVEQINKKFGLDIKVEKVIDNLSIDFIGSHVKEGDPIE